MADKQSADEKAVEVTLPTGTKVTVPASEVDSLRVATATKGSK